MQSTDTILLIKPSGFVFNTQTASSNSFQNEIRSEGIAQKAIEEFENFRATLDSKGIRVIAVDDTPSPQKPDAVFPNNWISFHPDGTVVLYPMAAANRRLERRQDIIDLLREKFEIKKIIDLSNYESENKFLEGTGSIVFDHVGKIAYACLSPRTDKDLLIEVCKLLNYKPVYFYSHDKNGKEIYHTNVMMCIGEKFAVICSESISDKEERASVLSSLQATGHEIIDIRFPQMNAFAGNMLCVKNKEGKTFLVMSQSAFQSLTHVQEHQLRKYSELLPIPIPTIETIGGGSARCMIAEIFSQKIKP
ncbi:MAG: amidinotransferase [Bacteroidetes bacterium]|nr:amidinotransferase [Bacteroidota bacterium]